MGSWWRREKAGEGPKSGERERGCVTVVMVSLSHWCIHEWTSDERVDLTLNLNGIYDHICDCYLCVSVRVCTFAGATAWVRECERCLWTSRCAFWLPCPSTIPHHRQIIPFLLPIFSLLLDWTGRDNLGLERAVRPSVLLIHLDGADMFNIHRSSAVGLNIFHYISSQNLAD